MTSRHSTHGGARTAVTTGIKMPRKSSPLFWGRLKLYVYQMANSRGMTIREHTDISLLRSRAVLCTAYTYPSQELRIKFCLLMSLSELTELGEHCERAFKDIQMNHLSNWSYSTVWACVLTYGKTFHVQNVTMYVTYCWYGNLKISAWFLIRLLQQSVK